MECGKQFQNHSRRKQIEKIIWNEYVYQRQTIHQLSEKYKKGKDWIRDRIHNIPTKEYTHTPQLVVIIADVTFFQRSFGIFVIRSPHLKKNLYVQEIEHETVDVYRQGRVALKKKGYTIKAIVLDGRREYDRSLAIYPSRCAIFIRSRLLPAIWQTTLSWRLVLSWKSLPKLSAKPMKMILSAPFIPGTTHGHYFSKKEQ